MWAHQSSTNDNQYNWIWLLGRFFSISVKSFHSPRYHCQSNHLDDLHHDHALTHSAWPCRWKGWLSNSINPKGNKPKSRVKWVKCLVCFSFLVNFGYRFRKQKRKSRKNRLIFDGRLISLNGKKAATDCLRFAFMEIINILGVYLHYLIFDRDPFSGCTNTLKIQFELWIRMMQSLQTEGNLQER